MKKLALTADSGLHLHGRFTSSSIYSLRAPFRPLALAALAGLMFGISHAQQTSTLDELVVTATRTEQPLSDLVADVSIIDREMIEKSGTTGVVDVLVRHPGIEFARNGGPGATTSLYIRGAETRYTAVFVDGVRVDSQSTGGAPWEALPLALIDRIEIVRGPAAAVYGSDAIGGVIQIFTRKGEQGVHPYVRVGLGNQGTYDAAAGLSGASGVWDYSLSGGYEESKGFNARTNSGAAGYNPDKDGFDRTSAQARLGFKINHEHRLDASLLTSRLTSDYDAAANRTDENKHRLHTLNLGWNAQWSSNYSTLLSVSDSTVRYETSPNPYLADTGVRSYLFQNEYKFGIHSLSASLERREDELTNLDFGKRDRSQNAVAFGYGLRSGPHSVQAHARYDDDSEFGGKGTGSLAYGFAFTPQWRATASYGTGFRVPTLYQRFSDYGVATLQPESSRNVEVGIHIADKANTFSVTVYRNNVKNQISYVSGAGACASAWGCYENTARARYEGVTIAGSLYAAGINWRASADFQDPKDLTTGKQLGRRAKRHGVLGADTVLAGINWGAEVQASSYRWDTVANTTRLGGYTLFNLYASKPLGKDLTLSARVDNLGDKNYENASTYATAGRTFRVGLKWAPNY